MSTIKADAIEAATGTNTDLDLAGKGTGVPDIASGFKVGGTAGVPVNNLRTGTDGELITWDASGDPATVAVGTATHVLTSNGAGAAPTFQAAAAGGAWTLIGTAAADDTADLTVTGISTTAYDSYAIAVSNIVPVTDSTDFLMRVGTSAGVYTTPSYAYHTNDNYTTSAAYDAFIGSGQTSWKLVQNIGSDSREASGGMYYMNALRWGATDVAHTMIYGNYISNQSGWYGGTFTGGIDDNPDVDRINILMASGNIEYGRLTVWGISHA